jgi:hypothetical protein
VTGVLPVREVAIYTDPNDVRYFGWVVSCSDLLRAVDVPGASCGAASVHITMQVGLPAGSYTVSPTAMLGMPLSGQPHDELRLASTGIAPLVPGSAYGLIGLPEVIVDPSALGSSGTSLPFTQFYVSTDGSAAAAERVRAEVQAIDPPAQVALADDPQDQVPQFAEVARIVGLGLIGSLALAGCSLAVATTTGLLQRRRQFVLLRAAGMPVSRLRALILLQAGVPLIAVSAASALLGVTVAQGMLRVASATDVPLPDLSQVVVLAASVAVAMTVVAATLPAADRLTRPQSLRSE